MGKVPKDLRDRCGLGQPEVEGIKIVGGKLHKIVSSSLKKIRDHNSIYDKDGELVRIASGIHPVSSEWLQVHLTSITKFFRLDKRSEEWVSVDCPKDLSKSILSMDGLWDLPRLTGFITAPTITMDGRIIDRQGLDKETGLFLDLKEPELWPGLPSKLTTDCVADACRLLWHPFSEFPFETSIDRGGFFAALLTCVVRPLLTTAPGFVISSPTAGSGKTLLAKCLAALAGVDGEVLSSVKDDEEMRKRLLSMVRVNTPVIILDNISGSLDSDALSAFLTCQHITDRVLGASRMISGKTNSLILITGNNPILVGDLNRRVLRARINVNSERPYLRSFELDPVEYVQQNRMKLVRAAIIILKASVRSGYHHGLGRLASFEMWCDFVRNAVLWVSDEGFLTTISDPVSSILEGYGADPETDKLRRLLSLWGIAFGPSGGTISQILTMRKTYEKAYPKPFFFEDFEEITSIVDEVAGERGNPSRVLAWWIRAHESRIVDGKQFVKNGTSQRSVVWACREAVKSES